jgi:hypothetical protein
LGHFVDSESYGWWRIEAMSEEQFYEILGLGDEDERAKKAQDERAKLVEDEKVKRARRATTKRSCWWWYFWWCHSSYWFYTRRECNGVWYG